MVTRQRSSMTFWTAQEYRPILKPPICFGLRGLAEGFVPMQVYDAKLGTEQVKWKGNCSMPVQAKTKKHKPTRMWLQLCSFCLSGPGLRPYCQTPKPSRKKSLRLPGLSWRRLAAGWASLSGIFSVGRLYTVQRIFICKYWSVAPPFFLQRLIHPASVGSFASTRAIRVVGRSLPIRGT